MLSVHSSPVISQTLTARFRAAGRRLLWLGCLALIPARLAAGAAETEGWQQLAGYLFRDAYEAFEREPAGSRTRELGLAASLLNYPPVTSGKIAATEARLRDLIAANGRDDAAMYARYLLARIAHLHRDAPIPEVEAAYRDVIRANPAHPAAQVAASRLALVLLYQRPDLKVPQRLAAAVELAGVAGAATLPETACAYYRALAGAALYYDICDERVLNWLKQAESYGSRDVLVATNLQIQLAEVARTLGRKQEAVTYYRLFLATILPTDNRYLTARERMQELAKESP